MRASGGITLSVSFFSFPHASFFFAEVGLNEREGVVPIPFSQYRAVRGD